jgi:sucrose-6-phosphate hydrolase SacC (GH32 family)
LVRYVKHPPFFIRLSNIEHQWKLAQSPALVDSLHQEEHNTSLTLEGIKSLIPFKNFNGRQIHLSIQFTGSMLDSKRFGVYVARNKKTKKGLRIEYNGHKKTFTVGKQKIDASKFEMKGGIFTLNLYLDNSSIEIFIGESIRLPRHEAPTTMTHYTWSDVLPYYRAGADISFFGDKNIHVIAKGFQMETAYVEQ